MTLSMDTVQGTPKWFQARQGRLTASRLGASIGLCSYSSRNQTLQESTGKREWKGDWTACNYGTRNEKNALKDYMIRTCNVVRTMGFKVHDDYDWLGGSPDGLVGDEGMIEIKCPFYSGKPHDHIPFHYLCQVNALMEILNREWCDYVSWTPTQMRIYRVYRDSGLFSFLLDRYAIFYAYMKRGADKLPRMPHSEKVAIQSALDMHNRAMVDYDFWSYMEPAIQKGVTDPMPPDSGEESPSPKRPCQEVLDSK